MCVPEIMSVIKRRTWSWLAIIFIISISNIAWITISEHAYESVCCFPALALFISVYIRLLLFCALTARIAMFVTGLTLVLESAQFAVLTISIDAIVELACLG